MKHAEILALTDNGALPEHSIKQLGLKPVILVIASLVIGLPEHSIKQLGLKRSGWHVGDHVGRLPEHSIKQLGLKHEPLDYI